MDLFLETPQQQAERMLRQQQRLMECKGRLPRLLRKMPRLRFRLRVRRPQRTIPYSRIHMRRSFRLTSAARVAAVWVSVCARWQ